MNPSRLHTPYSYFRSKEFCRYIFLCSNILCAVSLTSVSQTPLCHCQAKLHGVFGVMHTMCGVIDIAVSHSTLCHYQAKLPGVVGVMHTMCGVIDIGESFYTVSLSS